VNWFYDPHIKNAYAYQYNFGIQRQLNNSTTLSANYVGSSTRRANIGGMYNTALKPSPAPNPQSRSLFPYMIAGFYDRSNGFADYNAFQLQLDKRFSGGNSLAQVAYTFSAHRERWLVRCRRQERCGSLQSEGEPESGRV
jgi:hypothetical protein